MTRIFHKAIRRARVRSNTTQQQLSDKLKVTKQRVTQIESGSRGVSEDVFLRVAEALGLSPMQLLAYAQEPEESEERKPGAAGCPF